MVPPNTHDWRLFIKPHELAFLLQVAIACRSGRSCCRTTTTGSPVPQLVPPTSASQAHGFLVDTAHFRGMRPTVDPMQLLRQRPDPSWLSRPPSPPLSDFVEISSLEVNYLGWAVKAPNGLAGAAQSVGAAHVAEAPTHPPGALAQGLRDFQSVPSGASTT